MLRSRVKFGTAQKGIEKALDKAKGAGGENYEVVRFEGYGPGGCTVIVDCLTDNNNRTFGEVRHCFTKTKAKIIIMSGRDIAKEQKEGHLKGSDGALQKGAGMDSIINKVKEVVGK
mgnify:CR=1 FL=1